MADEPNPATGEDDNARPDEAALEKLKANNAKLLKEAADARKAKADLEAWKTEREEADARAAEDQDKAKGEFAKVETRLTTERDDYKGRYEKLVGDLALKGAMVEAKIDDLYKPAVEALLREKGVKLTKDGEAQINGQPVGDYVKEWAASDNGKPFILNGNSGGNAPGGSNSNGKSLADLGDAERLKLAREGKLRPLTGA